MSNTSLRLRAIVRTVPLVLIAVMIASSAGADCNTPDCDPEEDACCADDCTWEPEDAVCFTDPCHTEKCTADHQCTKGSSTQLPTGETCIDRNVDPCMKGECSAQGVCVNISNGVHRCEDGEPCTDDADLCLTDPLQNGKFIRCLEPGDPGYSSSFLADGTSCSTGDDAAVCINQTCQSGACAQDPNDPFIDQGAACSTVLNGSTCEVRQCDGAGACTVIQGGPAPIECPFDPCRVPGCVLNGETVECVLDGPLVPAGTSCDTNPWDCIHQRCGRLGTCRNHEATTEKICDPQDPPDGIHCLVSTCDKSKHCRTGAPYESFLGANKSTIEVENEQTTSRNNQFFDTIATCPKASLCNIDVCVGGADQCEDSGFCDPSLENGPCALPECEATCIRNGNACECTP